MSYSRAHAVRVIIREINEQRRDDCGVAACESARDARIYVGANNPRNNLNQTRLRLFTELNL